MDVALYQRLEKHCGAGMVLEVEAMPRFTVYVIRSWRRDRKAIVNFLIAQDGRRMELDPERAGEVLRARGYMP